MDKGETLLFVAHEHVLRGMVQTLTGISNEEIMDVRIPNAAPFIFEFDEELNTTKNYYLQDEDTPILKSGIKEVGNYKPN